MLDSKAFCVHFFLIQGEKSSDFPQIYSSIYNFFFGIIYNPTPLEEHTVEI